MIYDYSGAKIYDSFADEMTYDYARDATSATNYHLFRINKTRRDGTQQYPFVRVKDSSMTSLELAQIESWGLIMNAGFRNEGLLIENGVVLRDEACPTITGAMAFTVNSTGDIGYVEADTTGKGPSYVAGGVVSAACGFFPIIEDYEDYDYPTDIPDTELEHWQYGQRNIFGQFGNGDYGVIIAEARGFDHSTGLTMTDAQRICKNLGLKFAYNLDGGGSVQLVLGKKMINLVYEGTSGRTRKNFLVFNGTTTFAVP